MKKILILAFTASVMLGACKKDKGSEEAQVLHTCATVTEGELGWGDDSPETYVIKFDEQGRVKQENSSWSNHRYEYYPDKIVVTEIETDSPSEERVTTYTLDAQGRIIKSVYNGESPTVYEYNSDGYLIKATWTSNGYTDTETYTWESGNLVKTVNGSFTINVTYSSDIIKDKLVESAISTELYCPEYYLQDYFGKKPKNAPVRRQSANSNYAYSYTKDSKGNITGYSAMNDDKKGWSYNVDYNCN